MIKGFSHKTIEALGYYVYVYSDPDTRRPFYVGKGKGNRVFNHMDDQSENEKVRKINDIKARGKEPVIEILAHGLDEETAFKVSDCSVNAEIIGAVTPGAVAGRAVNSVIESCEANVTLDGEPLNSEIGETVTMYESSDQHEEEAPAEGGAA